MSGDFSGHYQRLSTTLGLGIALEMRKHGRPSLDLGIAPAWWELNNGRNMYTDDDVSERYPRWQLKIRLQVYYWR